MDKKNQYMYAMEYYSVIKKEGNPASFATLWMNCEGIMLSKISQTEEDKYTIISLIYGILKKKKSQTHRNREQIGWLGERLVRGTNFWL